WIKSISILLDSPSFMIIGKEIASHMASYSRRTLHAHDEQSCESHPPFLDHENCRDHAWRNRRRPAFDDAECWLRNQFANPARLLFRHAVHSVEREQISSGD